MRLSKPTIKQLVKYLSGIKGVSPHYASGDEVISDFQDYFLFINHKTDEFPYTTEEALFEGLSGLNGSNLLVDYLNTRIDKRLFSLDRDANLEKSIKLLNEILLPDGYVVNNQNDKALKILKIDIKNSKENYPDALWALADDLRHRKQEGEFSTYEEAYIFGSKNYSHNGKEIKPSSLRNEWHKASSAGRV